MNTLDLVDPAARDFAMAFAALNPARQPLADYRASLAAAMGGAASEEAPLFEERWAPGGYGQPDVRMLVYRPEEVGDGLPAILFIHASGFIAGRPDWTAAANAAMARDRRALVVAVNYRLAPETPFPGPIEDCYLALTWLFSNAAALGVDPARIVIMGESAGGGLAAALAQLNHERSGMKVAGQVLIYPMLDPRTGTPEAPSDNPLAGEFVWTREHNRFGWDAMRGDRAIAPERLGHFAPALASSLSGLPPAFVAVGALDLFAEEAAAYALHLNRAAVPTEFHVYPGGVHGFDFTDSSIAAQYKVDLAAALDRMFGR